MNLCDSSSMFSLYFINSNYKVQNFSIYEGFTYVKYEKVLFFILYYEVFVARIILLDDKVVYFLVIHIKY